MALNRYCVLLIFVSFLMAAPGARGQPMNDGEACLEGNGQSLLDEAYCRRALSRPGLAAAERAALLTARAAALARLGEGREAGIEIARALALNPGSAQAHFVRGVLAPNGMADLDRAIALNPFFAAALAHRGVAHLRALEATPGALAAARTDFGRALEIQLRLSLVLFAQGVLYFRQGRFDRAAARFRRVLALSPVRHPMAALWLAAALARQGGDASRKGGDASRQGDDPATALAPFLWWWEDGIWPAPLVQLWSGRIGPAAAIVAVMKQIGPVRAQGAFFIGQWYLAHGDRMTAEQWLDRARDLASPKMMELIALKPAASN